MRRMILLAASLVAAAAPTLAAQSDSGHVWTIGHWRAREGHETAFSQAINEYSRPVFDWMVEKGYIVSYMHLELADVQEAWEGQPTHLLIVELPNREAQGPFLGRLEEACGAVFGESAWDWFSHFETHRRKVPFANPWISTIP